MIDSKTPNVKEPLNGATQCATKLPYAPPVLKEFGSVNKLTMGGGATQTDGNGTRRNK